MEVSALIASLESPDVQHRILGSYRGPYSIGITRSSSDLHKYAVRVRVEGEATDIPPEITINGEQVEIVATGGFVSPRALNGPSGN